MVYDGHQAPEGVLLPQEEEGYGGQPVKALAVPDGRVIPAEGHQNSAQLVNLKDQKVKTMTPTAQLWRVYATAFH